MFNKGWDKVSHGKNKIYTIWANKFFHDIYPYLPFKLVFLNTIELILCMEYLMKSRLFIRCIYIWLWPVRHVIMKPDGQLIIKFPPQQKQSTVSFYFYLFFFQFKNFWRPQYQK